VHVAVSVEPRPERDLRVTTGSWKPVRMTQGDDLSLGKTLSLRKTLQLLYLIFVVAATGTGCGEKDLPTVSPPPDPDPVVDLRVQSVTPHDVTICWVVPATPDGKDPTKYDIRYGTRPESTSGWWDSLAVAILDLPTPGSPGSTDILQIADLSPETSYTVGVRLQEAGIGWSEVSYISFRTPRETTHRVPADYPTIQEAIDAALPADTVLIAPGTYTGTGNRGLILREKQLVIRSEAGPAVTIIDSQADPWNPARGISLIQVPRGTVLDGLTIRGGWHYPSGGGIWVGRGSLTVQNCIFTHNWANGGSAVFVVDASAVFINCKFVDHDAPSSMGETVEIAQSNAELRGCEFVHNRSGSAALGVVRANARIIDCVISNNAAFWGGLLVEDGSTAVVEGTLIANNWGIESGGVGMYLRSTATIVGSTITRNLAADNLEYDAGGIHVGSGCELMLSRSIVWGNCGESVRDLGVKGTATISCCALDTAGVRSATEITFEGPVIHGDPEFCHSSLCGPGSTAEYDLKSTSPCLPAGNECQTQIGARGACEEVGSSR
jgi:hypothetical protein